MIISRTPLRISLFGGGTDFKIFYEMQGGNFLSFAIDKYVYISAHPLVESKDILLKYSKLERVNNPESIVHPVFRAVCSRYKLNQMDFSVSSDVPAGTGLGSSSAFTVGLLNVVHSLYKKPKDPGELAFEACDIEINELKEPIGIQDQYTTAFGGLAHYKIGKTGLVSRNTYEKIDNFKEIIDRNFVLLRVKGPRNLNKTLSDQKNNMVLGTNEKYLLEMNNIANNYFSLIESGPKIIGEQLLYAWNLKKQLSKFISNDSIDSTITELISEGYYGAKLLGAGESGYILVVGNEKLITKLKQKKDVETLTFSLDTEGTRIVYQK
jgi:D-glycero-alpha-D-manno-heptose-7-phosphate kinase